MLILDILRMKAHYGQVIVKRNRRFLEIELCKCLI